MFENRKLSTDNLLSSVTIVICSYGRPRELSETVSFLRSSGIQAIVMDGSRTPHQELSKGQSPLLTYIHSPEKSYQERMGEAAGHLGTPFVMSLSDDEYFVPSAVAAAVNFMINNEDYAACTGEAIGFDFQSGQVRLHGQYEELRGFSLRLDNPVRRMHKHLSRYRIASYYSVVRTQVWSHCWGEISKRAFTPYGVSELQFEAALSFSGKFKVLPVLIWWRNLANSPVRGSGDPDDLAHVQFADWWGRKIYLQERKDFVQSMAKLLLGLSSKDSVLSEAQLARVTYETFRGYYRSNTVQAQIRRNLCNNLMSRLSLGRKTKKDSRIQTIIQSYLAPGTLVDEGWVIVISDRIRNFYGL